MIFPIVIGVIISIMIMVLILFTIPPPQGDKPYAECNGVYVSCIYHDTQEILERLDRIESRLNQTD